MYYSFNSEIAIKYGVDGAIMIENLHFWISKNKANEKHFYDGRYWTYNSLKAFEKLFPFWSSRQIERILRNLINQGAIVTGNYNKIPYDRTKWYALTESVISIYANGEIEERKCVNENNETVEPIPDNKPDNKPDNNINKKEKEENSVEKAKSIENGQMSLNYPDKTPPKTEEDIDKNKKGKKKTKKEPTQTEIDGVINAYTSNEELKATLIEFVKFRKSIKRVMTTHALELLIKKLDKLSNDDNTKIEILNESIMNGWNGIFPLKDNSTPNNKNKGGFNNEPRNNTSKDNEPSKGESKDKHDAEYWKEQNRILDEMLDSYLQM